MIEFQNISVINPKNKAEEYARKIDKKILHVTSHFRHFFANCYKLKIFMIVGKTKTGNKLLVQDQLTEPIKTN